MANPSNPAQAKFPIVPWLLQKQFVDERGLLTLPAVQLIQQLWAAIQGSGGIIDQTVGMSDTLSAEIDATRSVAQQALVGVSDSANDSLLVQVPLSLLYDCMQRIENLEARVSSPQYSQSYDEGAWTPVLAGSATAGTQTYSARAGQYARIGNIAVAWFDIELSALDGSAAGSATITGLPFLAGNMPNIKIQGVLSQATQVTLDAGFTSFGVTGSPNAGVLDITEIGSNVGIAAVPITNFSNSSALSGAVFYLAQ